MMHMNQNFVAFWEEHWATPRPGILGYGVGRAGSYAKSKGQGCDAIGHGCYANALGQAIHTIHR